jgi:hypothetical protein
MLNGLANTVGQHDNKVIRPWDLALEINMSILFNGIVQKMTVPLQYVYSPWNHGANWSELGSNPARREISLDLNHSITASLLGGLAVCNSKWAEGLRLLLLAGLHTEKSTLLQPQHRTVKTSGEALMTCHSKNTENKNGFK